MLTFKQFVTELAREDVTLSPAEVREMTERFGKKALQMGHLQDDGSMLVPLDCVVEAARSLGSQTLSEAAEILNNEQMVSFLKSGEILVERVVEARERKLRDMIRAFQNEPEAGTAHKQWLSFLKSGEILVERVVEARERKLRDMIRAFENEPETGKAHEQWKQIEKDVFSVDYND